MSTPIAKLPGVGPKRANTLIQRLDIRTTSDLLRHLPMRYEYEAAEDQIENISQDAIATARGQVAELRWVPGRFGKKGRFEVSLQDDTGSLLLTWFNAQYLSRRIQIGDYLRVQGKTKSFGNYTQIINPKWEKLAEPDLEPARDDKLRPVYPATEQLASSHIERVIENILPAVLPHLIDPLPDDLLKHHEMPPLADALRMVHQPNDLDETKAARRRLAYNELLLLQLGIAMKKAFVRDRLQSPPLTITPEIDKQIRDCYPFELTDDQNAVVKEIAHDLSRISPMNRLLQGDVGSGKTAVALYALLAAYTSGKQAVLLAPTELLAEQHYLSICNMLHNTNVSVALLTGSGTTKAEKQKRQIIHDEIQSGDIDIVIGTHAVLSDTFEFKDLAVVIIDEQHRFGVMQRAFLKSKNTTDDKNQGGKQGGGGGKIPHHLVMTATPIPRTLSLTVFGDLDVSTIRGLPPGRSPIINRVVDMNKTDDVYRYLNDRLARGEQAYVVLPAIENSGLEDDPKKQLRNVTDHAKLIQNKYCPDSKVGLVHGRLKSEEREEVMKQFRDGSIHVLVATTVIEVGVDVPNATIMIIEHAERFGLAQLHQLRGRVGRGTHGIKSLCVFIAEPTTEDGEKRMKAIASSNDGFKISELDLEIRGMGDFFGTRQAGAAPLRVAQIPQDMDLLMLAKRDAESIIETDPLLKSEPNALLKSVLLKTHGHTLGLIDVG
ncbi:ATP-dependent DNA helicase RecG [Poriferisphaera corsica]|uniref:ATP-dependent DNA helicase RecG n=2 Tax=Poriferisphaera corsica TaxID=2528020 RepID=A0A517YUV3_9BACT|nr:ATP-dependent DNA helicase RecG [Poriferisphaera corsica]